MNDPELADPVDIELRRRRWHWFAFWLAALFVAGGLAHWLLFAEIPVDYVRDEDHFKYGSIGSDYEGVPLRIWKALPGMFPEYLPDGGRQFRSAPDKATAWREGYASFGFILEEITPGQPAPLPVGFSQRRVLVDRVGLNCAVCHTSTVRVSAGMDPDAIYGGPPALIVRRNLVNPKNESTSVLVYGMPGNLLDLEAYFAFLFNCAQDQRFTADQVMQKVLETAQDEVKPIGMVEGAILKRSVGELRATLLTRRHQLHYLAALHAPNDAIVPRFGPGRVDTFSPYKSIQFGFPFDGTYGIADYPSIWNQAPREGMHLHWDGNNQSVFERNISASLGAAATPVSLDFPRMLRVASWIGSPAPPCPDSTRSISPAEMRAIRQNPYPARGQMKIPQYPFATDAPRVNRGATLFRSYCAECHDWNGARVGTTEPISVIATDPARLDSYTEALQSNQNLLGSGQWWRFKNFRKTNGYANAPLDGVWARAPYLHNGSVPALLDLFRRPCGEDDLRELGITDETNLISLSMDSEQVHDIVIKSRHRGLRPPVFYRGDDEYDTINGGFRCDRGTSADGRALFLYSTVEVRDGKVRFLLGNGHSGHYGKAFGTSLSEEEKLALVEYQKTLGRR
jgi:mono/diheme cytochrome c family protein